MGLNTKTQDNKKNVVFIFKKHDESTDGKRNRKKNKFEFFFKSN